MRILQLTRCFSAVAEFLVYHLMNALHCWRNTRYLIDGTVRPSFT